MAQLVNRMKYMTLSTVDQNGNPWVTPLFYVFDDQYNFYWYSRRVADHSKNISHNSAAAVSIYDQNMSEDNAGGLYLKGVASEVEESDLDRVIGIYVVRSYPGETEIRNEFVTMTNDFKKESPLRFYRFTPKAAWTLGKSELWNNKWLDFSEEIKIVP